MNTEHRNRYMTASTTDESWGIFCTTAGYQHIKAGESYPPSKIHPKDYYFAQSKGRVLSEYQLIYITEGEGYFESASCKRSPIQAGCILFLFPDEWHSYAPSSNIGWKEYWVGYKGEVMDMRISQGFFPKSEPIVYIGESPDIESYYIEIIRAAEQESKSYQILSASILLHILGSVIYKKDNHLNEQHPNITKIEKARQIMRNNILDCPSLEQIAEDLHISYSKFRRDFKNYVGLSPRQYHLQLKHNKAKEMLCNMTQNISDIAYELGFDNISQFSAFFKLKEGMSASKYRERYGYK